METANTRTPSARARSTRNVPAVNLADVRAEAALHQFVGGEHFAAKILGQE